MALDYWVECIAVAAEECEATLTDEQITYLAEAAEGGHEHYGMAYYSPPSSDRLSAIEAEWKAKYKTLEAEFNAYRNNAETAVKRALRQHDDVHVTIEARGEVLRHCGRTDRIQ